jgi:hypothetical protein
MTLKEMSRFIKSQTEIQQQYSNKEMQQLLLKLKDKPFWYWHDDEHTRSMKEIKVSNNLVDKRPANHCCFNHIIGLPQKNGQET